MKKGIKPDEAFFVIAATIGIAVISLYAVSAVFNLIIYIIK
jgi:hypothetical protein